MQNIKTKDVHIGKAIDKQREKLGLTKTEFARRIGMRQQHVNGIFERKSIDTEKLLEICQVLDYNFFALYCEFPPFSMISVNLGDGAYNNYVGDLGLLTELEVLRERTKGLQNEKVLLQGQIELLNNQIRYMQQMAEKQ